MSYLGLARKFRPQNFDEVIGQDHISQTLKNAISEKRISHAYLFSGPRGCGKTTMARILAKALNCKNGPTAIPCGICENCLEVSKSSSVDVLEIDGASNNGIDEIRALRENVKFASAHSNYKIYIIDEAHQITTQAFNALLKTLEEPPAHVIFIMATTEQHKIPVTILSRCQKYRFKLIAASEMASAIQNIAQKEGFEIDSDALGIITASSGGSMRDALSLLDQAVSSNSGKITGEYIRGLLGLLPKDIIALVTENIAKGDIQAILKIVKKINDDGYNILQFARDLRDHLRQVMIYLINPEVAETSTEDKKLFEIQKSLFTVSRHIRMNNLLSKALEEMRWHDQPRILLEMYLLKMSEPYYNVSDLINRIAELEKNAINKESSFGSSVTEQAEIKESYNVAATADLISVWDELVAEIMKKHPLTAQSLKKAVIKVTGDASIQLSVTGQFDYEGIMGFQEQITKLFQRKTGINVKIKVMIEKNALPNKQEDIVVKDAKPISPVEYTIKEDLKETAKTAVPKHIEDIAKKFKSTAKKITDNK
ncbi:DNA polymerase III subunit gamma/tau [Candidatus Endomicrobiellum devescovinae]|jgi:DNA polymerase-3 subunit gamma/tau|uniref:DNA polymerase III subunit gamma/tau n=1 Tax=Candidatus Endomicrobiellum devescovinae TaxID=3242322 RepID=UPI0028173589|nr:DNA polymerase III subunit gamma/tau [Endomicrobium sp.]